jgi:hypothetical protein
LPGESAYAIQSVRNRVRGPAIPLSVNLQRALDPACHRLSVPKRQRYTDPLQAAPATPGAYIHQLPQLGSYVPYGAAVHLPSPGPTEWGFVETRRVALITDLAYALPFAKQKFIAE